MKKLGGYWNEDRGLLEIIERDGNMLTYLAQATPHRIIVDDFSVQDIVDYFEKYRLKVDLFSTMTDVGIASMIAVIRDETGSIPYLSVGSSIYSTDMRSQLNKISSVNPDMMYMPGYPRR